MKLPLTVIATMEARSGLDFKDLHDREIRELAQQIHEATGAQLGLNTLKRILGIGTEVTERPHLGTLNTLAHYLGAKDWSSLLLSLDDSVSRFGKLEGEILSQELQENKVISLTCVSDRELELLSLGGENYKVISSLNSKLQKGDICVISSFIIKYPLFIKQVLRNGQDLGRYTAGIVGGLTSLSVRDKI